MGVGKLRIGLGCFPLNNLGLPLPSSVTGLRDHITFGAASVETAHRRSRSPAPSSTWRQKSRLLSPLTTLELSYSHPQLRFQKKLGRNWEDNPRSSTCRCLLSGDIGSPTSIRCNLCLTFTQNWFSQHAQHVFPVAQLDFTNRKSWWFLLQYLG